jgi:hypothetical protein
MYTFPSVAYKCPLTRTTNRLKQLQRTRYQICNLTR